MAEPADTNASRHSLYTVIRKTIGNYTTFDGSDQQRLLDALLNPVPESDFPPRSVQSAGVFEDEYRLGRARLGEGNLSMVNICCHRKTGKVFAVKITYTKPHLLLSESHRRISYEVKIMERLVNHRNIISIKRAFFDPNFNSISIVMELASQGSLRLYLSNRLKWNPLLDVELDSRQIIFQVCNGLEYIHSQNIVHCDIKPENILLTSDTPPVAKISDFGSAYGVGSSGFLTKEENFGTVEYMAPERAWPTKANGGFDHRADCWSVGAITFKMLTGHSHLMPLPKGLDLLNEEVIAAHEINWDVFNAMKDHIHPNGHDFVRSLLERAPASRLTMDRAMRHPWFQNLDCRKIPRSMAVVVKPPVSRQSTAKAKKRGRRILETQLEGIRKSPRLREKAKVKGPGRSSFTRVSVQNGKSAHTLRRKKAREASMIPRSAVPLRRSSRLVKKRAAA